MLDYVLDVSKILTDPQVVFFLLLVLLLGLFNGVTLTFNYLYIRQKFSASQLVLGLCVLVSVVSEIPALLFGGVIVEKVDR